MSSISGDNNNNDASSARIISIKATAAESNNDNNVRESVPEAADDMQLDDADDMQVDDVPPPTTHKRTMPKNKRKLSRKLRGPTYKKRSRNNIKATKAALGIDPSANDQSVISAMCIPSIEAKKRSPNKEAVKQDNVQLRGQVTSLIKSGYEKEDANTKLKAELSDVSAKYREVLVLLRKEKVASNTIIANAMKESDEMMEEAAMVMEEADDKARRTEEAILDMKYKCNEEKRKVRGTTSILSRDASDKHKAAMDKVREDHDIVMRANQERYDKEKVRSYLLCVI